MKVSLILRYDIIAFLQLNLRQQKNIKKIK